MAKANEHAELYRKHTFEVELVDGPKVGGFDKISGLTMQMETVEYREGGVNNQVHKLPGQYSHSTIVLENGIANDKVILQWMDDLKHGKIDVAEARSNVEIKVRGGEKDEKRWGFEVFDAYPIQWDGPDLRADDESEIARQTLELAHRGFTNLSGTPG